MAVSTIDRTSTSNATGRRLVPVLALTALISTILLITMGSIVRVTGYGLGCPDWPLCYGQVIPPTVLGAWVEFSHRLLGGLAGIQIVLLGLFAWRDYRDRPWVFWPAIAAVGLLIVQVSLGGLHVIFEIPPVTGWIHTGVAMLIVGLLAVGFGGTWPSLQSIRETSIFRDRRFVGWLSVTTVVTYFLVLTGSFVTRSGASLACPSFPLCGSSAPAMRRLIDIQMLHRFTAYSVAALTVVLVIWLLARQDSQQLKRYAIVVAALLLVQLGLGVSNVLLRLPMWSRVLHLAVAATFWVSLVVLWTLCCTGKRVPGATPSSPD
jgi:heme A synthase